MTIEKIGIVGAGTMGNGITQAFAVKGHVVTMTDVADTALARGLATIDGSLERLVKKEKLSPGDKSAALARIRTSTSMESLKGADLVIEAATENLSLKLGIFAELDRVASEHAVIASNTSSISITRLAAATRRPDRVMQLVELIRGLQTSEATYALADAAARAIGKAPVNVRNSPGFVVNRMLCPMINEAVFVLAEGLATAEEIDHAMKLGANHPIGRACAVRSDRARRRARRDERALRGLQGPEVPARAAARRDGRGRLSGSQVRAGILHLLVRAISKLRPSIH